MKIEFDYLERVNFAATVCDKNGIVLYQNSPAIERDGNVIGMNLYGCHNQKSQQMIRHMIESGKSNTYQSINHGKCNLVHQTPWFEEDGSIGGLIELEIGLPEGMPTYDRG